MSSYQMYKYRLTCLDNGMVFESSSKVMEWLGFSEQSRANIARLISNPSYRLGGYQWKIEKIRKYKKLQRKQGGAIYADGYEAAQSLVDRPLTKSEKAKISQQIRMAARNGCPTRTSKIDNKRILIGEWVLLP